MNFIYHFNIPTFSDQELIIWCFSLRFSLWEELGSGSGAFTRVLRKQSGVNEVTASAELWIKPQLEDAKKLSQ